MTYSAWLTARSCPADFALQNPRDYIEVLKHAVPEAIAKSMVDPAQIKGIGIDFTSATVIAAKEDGTPLCDLAKFTNNPHAYVKLWKHHGAQEQADRIVSLAKERGESLAGPLWWHLVCRRCCYPRC